MAVKTVKVESVLDAKFKLECMVHGHKVIVDQPANAGGMDAGPTPLDYLLVSLAGCIGSISRIVAMQKRIALRGMKITVEGDINTDGLLGKPTNDSVGFKEFRILADIDADMTAEEKEAFVHEVDARCPVSFNLLNSTPVKIQTV
ncbi:MAG: OsmC family protein [Kiritimatiellales bacterium]